MELNTLEKILFEKNKINENLKKNFSLIKKIADKILKTLENKSNIYTCGNGGSAGDAQHFAAEGIVRLKPQTNRKPIPIISLALDSSSLTACANDYGYDYIFSRPLEAFAKKKDLLICYSTSGKSKNIINVLKQSKKQKIKSIGLLGKNGGIAKKYCDIPILVKKGNTARIQESHIFLGHFIFSQVEDILFFKLK